MHGTPHKSIQKGLLNFRIKQIINYVIQLVDTSRINISMMWYKTIHKQLSNKIDFKYYLNYNYDIY